MSVSALEVGRAEESVNGADLEIWLEDTTVDPEFRWFGWRVQAKRATARQLKDPRKHQDDPYRVEGLDKRTRAEQQCDLLINETRPIAGLVPLYWIYANTADVKYNSSYRRLNIGPIQVVHADFIKARIEASDDNSRRPAGWNWLNRVAADGWSLHRLWCSPPRDDNPLAAGYRIARNPQRDISDFQDQPTDSNEILADGDAVADPPAYVRRILTQDETRPARHESLLVLQRN